jgi:L-asparaginase
MKILILNIGGTFNKVYNSINGNLEVIPNNNIIKNIFKKFMLYNKKPKIKGLIYKDSLFMDKTDRKQIVSFLQKTKYKKIILIHGTDTMHLSAKEISRHIDNKTIILTGAMKPYSIEPTEATANLMSAYGFIQNCKKGIYISMNGLILPYNQIIKDKTRGYFCGKSKM